MRILFLSRRYFPAISGMSVYAQNLLKHLVAAGHQVTMISQYRGDAAGAGVYGGGPPPAIEGVDVIGLEAAGEQEVNASRPADFERDLREMIAIGVREHAAKDFDVVHAQYGYPNGLAALEISRQIARPNVVSIQGGDGHWVGSCCRTHYAAMQAVLRHAGQILIGSRSFAQEVMQNHDVCEEIFEIVPGATDMERFGPAADSPGVSGRRPERPVFLYHGRVDLRKGLGELIDAMRLLVDQEPEVRLVVSGIGPDVTAVADRIQQLRLGEHVEMTGYCAYDDAPRIYGRGHIFVSPTYSEGFSNTILEAMASGLAVISTDAVGVKDCIDHGRNGLLVPLRDPQALATAMRQLLYCWDETRKLAAAGLRDVRERYCWPVVAKQIIACYERLQGTAPDVAWAAGCDPQAWTIERADLNCRFRTAPHLL